MRRAKEPTERFNMRMTDEAREKMRTAARGLGITETQLVKNAVNVFLAGFRAGQELKEGEK